MNNNNNNNKIYFESQVGALCGLHCLNNLLQNNYFNEIILSQIGQELDEIERKHMLDSGTPPEVLQYLESNVDDSGNFSIQVLKYALEKNHNLNLLNCQSEEVKNFISLNIINENDENNGNNDENNGNEDINIHNILNDKQKMFANLANFFDGFICHREDHWFTIRKIRNTWYNFNSFLSYPELISDSYLSLLLIQLVNDGYSVFVVQGDLSNYIALESDNFNSEATVYNEDDLQVMNAMSKPELNRPTNKNSNGQEVVIIDGIPVTLSDDSNSQITSNNNFNYDNDYDEDLQLAMALSLK